MLFVTLLHKWPRYFRIRNCVIKLMNMSSATNKGEFVRKASSFRNWITEDGSSGFPSAAGRYHLYVSLACPWAHRTLIVRRLKGLDKVISVNVVDHFMGEKGWKFDASVPDATADTVNDCTYIREVYFKADKDYQVRFSMYVVILAIPYPRENKPILNKHPSPLLLRSSCTRVFSLDYKPTQNEELSMRSS